MQNGTPREIGQRNGPILRPIRRYGDCEGTSVSRRIKDVVPTAIALAVLGGLLLTINPRLRERAAQMVADPEWDVVRGKVMHAAVSSVMVVSGYADGHTYLFAFFVAACVFVVLMLKVIA